MRQVPDYIQKIWRTPIWRINPDEKSVYLTFDDGPNPKVTPLVLDILDKFGVKATFFWVGENVKKYPEVFREVKRRGHTVGNHTFNLTRHAAVCHAVGGAVCRIDFNSNITAAKTDFASTFSLTDNSAHII